MDNPELWVWLVFFQTVNIRSPFSVIQIIKASFTRVQSDIRCPSCPGQRFASMMKTASRIGCWIHVALCRRWLRLNYSVICSWINFSLEETVWAFKTWCGCFKTRLWRLGCFMFNLPLPATSQDDKFYLGRRLGSGSFGQVFLAKNRRGKELAVKVESLGKSRFSEWKRGTWWLLDLDHCNPIALRCLWVLFRVSLFHSFIHSFIDPCLLACLLALLSFFLHLLLFSFFLFRLSLSLFYSLLCRGWSTIL